MYENNIIYHKDINKLIEKWGCEAELLLLTKDWKCIIVNEATAVVFQNPNIDPDFVFFGYISLPDDIDSAKLLFSGIESWANEKRAVKIIGPINYATWMSYRLMIDGWNFPEVRPETTNPKYVPNILDKLGYSIYYKYSSALTNLKDLDLITYESRYEELKREGYMFRTYIGKESLIASEEMYEIAQSFSANPLYSPIPRDIFKNIYLKSLIKEDTYVDLCYKNGILCGYSVNYINPTYKDWWVLKSIAVREEMRGNNIGSAFRYLFDERADKNGCSGVIHHYRYDGNVSVKLAKGGNLVKRYALFGKELKEENNRCF